MHQNVNYKIAANWNVPLIPLNCGTYGTFIDLGGNKTQLSDNYH